MGLRAAMLWPVNYWSTARTDWRDTNIRAGSILSMNYQKQRLEKSSAFGYGVNHRSLTGRE
jgi:hypothetical protein